MILEYILLLTMTVIFVISVVFKGPHDALNRALASATGDIIVVMPANDVFTAGAFSTAARVLSGNASVMLAYGDSQLIDDDGAAYQHWPAGPFDLDALFWTQYFLLQSTYIRREVFDSVGNFDADILGPGDTEWLFRVAGKYPPETLFYITETLSGHRRCERFDSVSFHNCEQGARALIAMGDRFLENDENVARLVGGRGRARAGILCRAALTWSYGGNAKAAWRTYVRAIIADRRALLNRYGMKTCFHLLVGREGSTWFRATLTMLHRWHYAFRSRKERPGAVAH